MKKLLIIILLSLFGTAYGQTIGYLRYDTVKMAKNGGTTELVLENATKAVTGGVLTNTGNGRTQFSLVSSLIDAWLTTGNAGTVAGTNFVGTTDGVGLMFKVNNQQAGFIDIASNNNNTSFGHLSASSNSTGANNTALGFSSLRDNVSGSGNIAIGSFSGFTQTNLSNRVYINSIDRSGTLGGDSIMSVYFAAQDAVAANQRIYHNGRNFTPYATNSTSSNRVMGFISGTGENTFLTLGTGVSIDAGVLNATGTGVLTASNGLTVASNNVKLGGNLIENTEINGGDTYTMLWDNMLAYQVAVNGVTSGISHAAGNGTNISSLLIRPDSINIEPYLGELIIDTLVTNTGQNTLMGWKLGGHQGDVGYITIGSGLSLAAGELTATGGTPSLTQYRLAIGDASNLLSTNAAITGNRALISDANGVPTHSATTATELGYVSGVTSAIQTQIDGKATSASSTANQMAYITGANTISGRSTFTDNGATTTISPTTTVLFYSNSGSIAQFQRNAATSSFTQVDFVQPGGSQAAGEGFSVLAMGSTYATSGIVEADAGILLANANLSAGFNIGTSHASAPIKFWTNGTEKMRLTPAGDFGIGVTPTTKLQVAGRFAAQQGADVASVAGAISLGTDGNSFEITGTNAITLISNVGWVNGSEVTLLFTSTATLTDGTANSGTDIGMELAGNVNFVASAGATLKLILSEIGGTQRFREVSRSVQ